MRRLSAEVAQPRVARLSACFVLLPQPSGHGRLFNQKEPATPQGISRTDRKAITKGVRLIHVRARSTLTGATISQLFSINWGFRQRSRIFSSWIDVADRSIHFKILLQIQASGSVHGTKDTRTQHSVFGSQPGSGRGGSTGIHTFCFFAAWCRAACPPLHCTFQTTQAPIVNVRFCPATTERPMQCTRTPSTEAPAGHIEERTKTWTAFNELLCMTSLEDT